MPRLDMAFPGYFFLFFSKRSMGIKIAPFITSEDFPKLREETKESTTYSTDYVHKCFERDFWNSVAKAI